MFPFFSTQLTAQNRSSVPSLEITENIYLFDFFDITTTIKARLTPGLYYMFNFLDADYYYSWNYMMEQREKDDETAEEKKEISPKLGLSLFSSYLKISSN